jgi:hypothetical protein
VFVLVFFVKPYRNFRILFCFYLIIIIILTAIGLMPGGSVTKIGRTYKKWTYIARKTHEKAARTTHEKTAYLTKLHSTVQVQRTEYKVQ